MLFRENDEEIRNVPEWVSWLIVFGFQWMKDRPNRRRIALISMPCDSAGAGLVALGAMIQRLGVQDANDLQEHEQRINNLDITVRLLDTRGQTRLARGPYIFEGRGEYGTWLNHACIPNTACCITDGNRKYWQFEGELPVFSDEPVRHNDFYRQLVGEEIQIVTENLHTSDSVIWIAGRGEGKKATRRVLKSVRFISDGGEEVNLNRLLSMGRGKHQISRMLLYSTRKGAKSPPGLSPPQLIVVDGAQAFLKMIGDRKFRGADIIGVFHRVVERVVLEGLKDRLKDMEDYYEKVDEENSMAKPPRGIGLALYRQRS